MANETACLWKRKNLFLQFLFHSNQYLFYLTEFLIESDAEVSLVNNDKSSALHLACNEVRNRNGLSTRKKANCAEVAYRSYTENILKETSLSIKY